MDIHRCRFVDYPPAAINALAFSRLTGSDTAGHPLRLAIGRANGNIEIWDPRRGTWFHEITFYGGRDRSVEGLAWTREPDDTDESGRVTSGRLRLFSIGYSSTVTEWDLTTGLPLRQSSGSHSEVWCLAAQPLHTSKKRSKSTKAEPDTPRTQDLAVGCADGSVVLLSTADDGLNFKRYIARTSEKRARALSIAWRDRDIFAVGFADTTIRVYDTQSNKLIRGISLGGNPKGGPKEKLIWAIKFLQDGTLVSGDSAGEVCFWDSQNYGQTQRIQSHEADILCLTSSLDGTSVFSSGMDRRTCAYKVGANGRWVRSGHNRLHKHDVKAMTSFENKKMSVIVSGGLDAQPVVTPLREFGNEYHRKLPYTPQQSPVMGAQRLLVSWWENQVSVWTVSPRPDTVPYGAMDFPADEYQLLSRLALKTEEHITCASITPAGDLLAVATVAEVKFFHLQRQEGHGRKLKIRKLETPIQLSKGGARLLRFSPDSRWLLTTNAANEVYAHRTATPTETQRLTVSAEAMLLRRVKRPETPQGPLYGSLGSYTRTITRTAISDDSRIIAVADLAGYIDTWVLEGGENGTVPNGTTKQNGLASEADSGSDSDASSGAGDSHPHRTIHGQRWRRNPSAALLPRLPEPPLLLSFRPLPTTQTRKTPTTPQPNGTSSHSHTHPDSNTTGTHTPDNLLTITAHHTLQIISTTTGRLTPWSRRNTSAALPHDFTVQLDRVTGCVWDVQTLTSDTGAGAATRSRVWLYASSWLCMFDLEQDLPAPSGTEDAVTANDTQALTRTNGNDNADSKGTKRKREHPGMHTRRRELDEIKRASGAGGKIKAGEEGGGLIGGRVRELDAEGPRGWVDVQAKLKRSGGIDGANGADAMDMDMDEDDVASDDDEDDDANAVSIRLQQLRRTEQQQHQNDNTSVSPPINSENEATNPNNTLTHTPQKRSTPSQPFFLTHKYRSILGVVPLTSAPTVPNDHHQVMPTFKPLEVAIIERPAWDLDLPPRFEKGGAWAKEL